MDKVPYSDQLDGETQVNTEEKIAARVKELSFTDSGDETLSDEVCAEIGRDALYIVLREFCPKFFFEDSGGVKRQTVRGE